ncbi:CD109 antigen-like isoform X2 [Lineus longissimus]|uniref:CD109 antigen-like isoform X2 n=1 Tax=Lineus longissimus TaxID=88925 RepID=UPI002B4EE1F7
MYAKLLLAAAAVLCLHIGLANSQDQQYNFNQGRKLFEEPTYFVVAPTRIYPNEEVQISVSILKLEYKSVLVRASIQKGPKEYASASYTFDRVSTKLLQLKMPEESEKGEYTLRVEGSVTGGGVGNFIFENDTKLEFFEKQLAVFIQTNKPVYKQGQTVYFRVVPVKPNLMPGSQMVDIYIEDSTNTTVRRWLSRQTTSGVLNMEFLLSQQPNFGDWRIRLVIRDAEYIKTFKVAEVYRPRFDVNVTVPNYIMDRGWGLPLLVEANDTSGRGIIGNGTIYLRMVHESGTKEPVIIQRDIEYFRGRNKTFFALDELRYAAQTNNIFGYEIFVNVSISSWWYLQNMTGWAYSYIYSSEIELNFLGNEVVPFKPGMMFSCYLAASRMDGSPLRLSDSRQIIVRRIITGGQFAKTHADEIHIIPDNGIFTYTFNTPEDAEGVEVKAFYQRDENIQAVQKAIRVYSPSNSFIQVTTATLNPTVNEYMIFTIRCNNFVDYVYYQIVAAGRIVVADRLAMTARQKTFSVALSRDMIPKARVVAYYIRPDREVVADALNFFVNGTRLYDVKVEFNKGKDFSGATAQMSGLTLPGVYISFAGIDRDQWVAGASPFLSEEEVVKELSTFDGHANSSYQWTWTFSDDFEQTVYYPASSYAMDTNLTFKYAGLIAFTDANVTRLPHQCNETAGELPCQTDRRCFNIEKRCDQVRDCQDGSDELGCSYPRTRSKRKRPLFMFNFLQRHFLDTSWLWKSYMTKHEGRVDITTNVPNDIPLSWMVSAFAMSREKGLGLMPRPILFDAVQAFIMNVEMPTNVRLGEQVGVRVTIMNFWNDYFECVVTLHASPQYKMVEVESMGIVSSYRPRTSGGDHQTLLYLEPGQTAHVYLAVLPIVRGPLSVTVSGATFIGSDTVTKPLFVSYDGVTNHYHTPYLVDLLRTGSNILPDLDIPVPEQFTTPEQREHLYVPGSGRALVRIVGDIVGPGFFEDHLTSENLLEKPYGCGEQAVYNLAVNMYYLKFLKATAQLTDGVKEKGLDYVNIALQRVMSYYNEEGYIQGFRDFPDKSVWLTAFALGSLYDAREADWEYDMFIPMELLNKIALWLISQQNKDTGAFYNEGPLYDSKMKVLKTVVYNGQTLPANISITAYTVVALAKAKGLTGNARNLAVTSIGTGADYLANLIPEITDTFQLTLVAYALRLAQHSKKGDAFQAMRNEAITENDFIYWSHNKFMINPVNITKVDTVPFYQPRWEGPWDGYATQASGYALLTYLGNNLRLEAYPTMKWLTYMRNTMGGQASTQDSIVALQALTDFAKLDASRDLYNVEFTVEATSSARWKRTIVLTRENFADLQTVQIPAVWGSVKVTVEGTGLATVSLDTFINVEYRRFLKYPQAKFFDLTIPKEGLKFSGRNFSIFEMTACARWTATRLSKASGLSVIQIDVPSGFVVTNISLREYVLSKPLSNLRRAVFKAPTVSFYLENLTTEPTCVFFRADRWYPVANITIQHRMKVYDYYEPGRYNQSLYTVYNLFNLGVCHVCGSFQCPYCADYNAGTTIVASISVLVMSFMFALYKNLQFLHVGSFGT